MPHNTVKVAISMPKAEYKTLEKIRHKLGVTRSALIDKAVSFWLKKQEEDDAVRKYQRSYKEKPEKINEILAYEKTQIGILSEEEDWK